MDLQKLTKKQKKLDALRPLPHEAVEKLSKWFDIELTYTSNAIEGNTLTRQETAVVIEKGITVKGKSIREHLEAINHKDALHYIRTLAKKKHTELTEFEIKNIHQLILKGNDDEWAGRYRKIGVKIGGNDVEFSHAMQVPEHMEEFIGWLREDDMHPVMLAAEAHYRLVSIHPFVDGNGRTSRLLMNLILIQYGYPMAIIRKEDRLDYVNSLEKAQMGGKKDDFYDVILKAVDRSFDVYFDILQLDPPKGIVGLLKIGELAKEAGVTVSTVRHYVDEGLFESDGRTKGGYMLFGADKIKKIRYIKNLQENERLTLLEIKKRL